MNTNKQEVIEKINNITARETFMSEIIWVKRDEVIDIVSQLDEPEKPPVPQYIADYIDSEQYSYSTLSEAIDNMDDEKEVLCWFYDNSETFAKAWLFGYTAKKYKVSFKKNGFSVGVQQRDGSVKAVFTKDELKEYGFDNLDEYEVIEVTELLNKK